MLSVRPAPPVRRLRPARRLTGLLVAATAIVGTTALSASGAEARRPAPPPATVQGMKILITNDDGVQPGSDSIGLYELRAALCDAGADVVVVGPWKNMSGASASITYGSSSTRFTLTTPVIEPGYADDCAASPSGGAVWGACVTLAAAPSTCNDATPSLTPADAATLGSTAAVQTLTGWAAGPELVISGINRGGNDGLNVNISGTLGAATIASSLGWPSVAISASSSGDALANARGAAAWSVRFVAELRKASLLPTGYVLSVNYPRVDRGPVTKAEWTSVAQVSPFATVFVHDGNLSFQSNFANCLPGPSCGTPGAGTDSAVYSSGKVAITPISVDRTLGLRTTIRSIADSLRVAVLVHLGVFNG